MSLIKLNNNSISAVTALPSGVGGKILQVVQSVSASETSTSSNDTVTATNLTASITPSSSSSKILINWSGTTNFSLSGTMFDFYPDFRRAISGGATTNTILNSAGSGVQKVYGYDNRSNGATQFDDVRMAFTRQLLDSCNTTSAVTYTCLFSYNVSAGSNGANGLQYNGVLTLQEVGA
tara:strand:- start:373 stop:906 length:534 start_codon:yes stop_codon:yes gene_type:complete